MKVTLTFDHEERTRARQAMMAGQWEDVLWSIDQAMRNRAKYKDLETISIDEVRTLIRSEMEDRGLSWSE